METLIVNTTLPNEHKTAVAQAVELLRAGEVVALPTETVYGLAADALREEAVVKIFASKERPRFDPLIVHLPERDWLPRVASLGEVNQTLMHRLLDAFWPGPLTLVLPRRELIPEIVTAGLTTVAVRMSAHPIFAQVLHSLGKPLAAPSANRFGRISPTSAEDVREELSGRIPLIVDGGATRHGLESTVVALRGDEIEILRSGPITHEELARFARLRPPSSGKVEAPGQLPAHYQPRTPLILCQKIATFAPERGKRYGALLWSRETTDPSFVESRWLSKTSDFREAAANLFKHLRALDRAKVDCIVAETLPEEGLGVAIMDRLRRAAHSSA